MIRLKQMIEILGQDECLEIFPSDSSGRLVVCGGEAPSEGLRPYLGWTCVELTSASLDSTGVSIVPPEEGAEDAKTEQE